ncbi:methyltransferase domain-containing protein [Microlunatus parietis]|uniref:SAM-dependent methyltransferase n=1 Tax=Microlunatus parietis TaxID=682979 RepID=A0A7Y9IC47_9ACTN|nr:methyltransferase domain-containing protein [Microlunatus parietis]NYE73881.1 SAM-dependent methyltransferase [Microlunatus parietis]
MDSTRSAPSSMPQPTAFHSDHRPADPAAELVHLVRILDLQERLSGVQRLRDWALSAVAPRPGERAVDVGCGTGSEVARLAALVGPSGTAIGVEPHPGLRATAADRLAGIASARLVDGAAEALPFPDGSVDVLRCERVFQHLADPEAAVREIARVLAAGGRTVLIDSDWETFVLTPGEAEVVARVMGAARRRMRQPTIGRRLRGLLVGAGLSVAEDVGASAVVFGTGSEGGIEFLELQIAAARDEGVITSAEAEDLRSGVGAAVEAGTAFCAVTMFAVVARR